MTDPTLERLPSSADFYQNTILPCVSEKRYKDKGGQFSVTRGEVGGDNGGKGGRVFRNVYKGHMDKTKVG